MKTKNEPALQAYIANYFQEYLVSERGVSDHTLRVYAYTIKAFVDYLYRIKHISIDKMNLPDFNRRNVNDFLDWLQSEKHITDRTRNNRLATLRSFAKYMQYEDITHMNQWHDILSIKKKNEAKTIVQYLSVEGIRSLLKVIPTDTKEGRRNLALIALIYDSGARAQEIADLTPSDVRLTYPYQVTLFGKGRKSRLVPIQEESCQLLKSYMQEHSLLNAYNNRHPLFYNASGNKLTTAGITYILQKYITMAHKVDPDNVPAHLSPHGLRHSKAMHLVAASVNLVYIRDILGHVSVKTTEIYARADSKQKRAAVENAYKNILPDVALSESHWEENSELIDWLSRLGKE